MTVLLEFSGATGPDLAKPCSFALSGGDARLLHVASEPEKEAVMDLALGRMKCEEGAVLLQGVPLGEGDAGRIGWVAANGGLISNLKVWENVTLPLWYHTRHQTVETERAIAGWLSALGVAEADWEKFMEATPDRLSSWQRKLAGLLRGLVQAPLVLVVDAAVFEHVGQRPVHAWMAALETYAAQGRAVLAVTDTRTGVPWKTIE